MNAAANKSEKVSSEYKILPKTQGLLLANPIIC